MTRGRKIAIGAVLAALALLFAAYVAHVNFVDIRAQRTIVEYRLPRGYHGWVGIHYGVAKAPTLPFAKSILGGTYTITIPSSGYLETSSPPLGIWHTEHFYDGDRLVEGAERGDGSIAGQARTSTGCEIFFVAFDAPLPAGQDPPRDGFPKACE